jgi:hypothetical protein
MLVILLMSMGTRGFHSKELVHDLDHHAQASMATLASAHTGAPEAGENSKSEPLDEMEHQLFHAVGTSYLLASDTACFSWDASTQILVPASSCSSLPVAELEPPFRPPRSSAFI